MVLVILASGTTEAIDIKSTIETGTYLITHLPSRLSNNTLNRSATSISRISTLQHLRYLLVPISSCLEQAICVKTIFQFILYLSKYE
jgi:hypothetical protein